MREKLIRLDLTFARGCFTWNGKSLEGDALRSSSNMDTGSAVLVSSGSTWNVRFQTSKVRSERSTGNAVSEVPCALTSEMRRIGTMRKSKSIVDGYIPKRKQLRST